MTIDDVTYRIIDESITNVICIDDKFVEPYNESVTSKDTQVGVDLFKAFSQNNKVVEVHKYESKEKCTEKILKNDLVILDWILNDITSDYLSTLNIIEKACESNIKYIAVYSDQILDNVKYKLLGYFSKYTRDEIVNFKEHYDDFMNCIEDFPPLISYVESFLISGEVDYVVSELRRLDFFDTIMEISKNTGYNIQKILELCSIIAKCESDEKCSNIELNIKDLDHEHNVYKISNTMIHLMNKTTSASVNAVKPEDIIKELSSNIQNSADYILTLIWIEANAKFRNHTRGILSKYSQVDQNVLLYHMKHAGDEFVIDDFMIEETKLLIENIDLACLDIKDKYIEDLGFELNQSYIKENKADAAVKYNSIITLANSSNSREETSLKFGDILKKDELYYLCITPHCDCERPSKIECNYMFVKGEKVNAGSSLDKAEQDHFSYVPLDDKYTAIQWSEKIVIMNTNRKYRDNKLSMYVIGKNNMIEFSYIGHQLENYTQRVANHTTSYVNRVGISLLNTYES